MKNTKIFFLLSFVLSILLIGCKVKNHKPAENANEKGKLLLNLSGKWEFKIGDDMQWGKINFDDNNWDSISVPASWENQGFHGYDGFAWYRKSFKLSADLISKDVYLILGYVDDVDQTFINGHLVGVSGGFPPNYRTAYNAFRKYFIPKEYLNSDGENIIAVRVFDDKLDGGIVSGEIGLYYAKEGFEPDINLSGVWNFKIGDDSLWSNKEFADTNWAKLMVPAHWEIQGFENVDGFAWYRKTFFVPSNFKGDNFILLLGKIDDMDQTFVNGTLVGSTGIWNFSTSPANYDQNNEYQTKRIYSVPNKLLKYGKLNTIAVRVYDGFRDGGIYEAPIGLITQNNYKKYSGRK